MAESEEIRLTKFKKGQEVWVEDKRNEEKMWQLGKVEEQGGLFVVVTTKSGALSLDLRQDSCFPVNPSDAADMTGLYFINEPGILMNLEARSLRDEAYTFMASVLVAVNPLKPLKNPDPKTIDPSVPHPFSVAENAFKQMMFANDNSAFSTGEPINQSVVTSGESGAGKTESCKMVLRHLVESTGDGRSSAIDQMLLQSNAITESFGNAQTLRNHNSSRFGKFMKLHFQKSDDVKLRGKQAWSIMGASVDTYLLERSRVTLHSEGERNFHVFYHILAGLDASQKKAYGFNEAESSCGFRYLSVVESPEHECEKGAYKKEMLKSDAAEYKDLVKAMQELKIDEAQMYAVFRLVAGVLHLGNVLFEDKNEHNNDVAVPVDYGSYDPLKWAADLLGLDHRDTLLKLLVSEEITPGGQVIVKEFDALKASYTRDALAKGLYNTVFDHVIFLIDTTLGGVSHASSGAPYIGILDIFGFETFKRNGFEQLLINFANEALQATFNRSVFENELALYRKEKLNMTASEMHAPPSNSACMELFSGVHKETNKKVNAMKRIDRGLLLNIDDESLNIDPSDRKMLANLHRTFGAHKDWIRPHPRLKHEQFIIRHFAGQVKYTVGYFVEKNMDKLPKAIETVFSGSASEILSKKYKNSSGKKSSATVVKKFRQQIHDLVDTLESTKCSFIRCVKPNKEMQRVSGNNNWFDRQYISMQLRNLSIPQTAEVLQMGLPTRLTYKSLVDSYSKVLPEDAIRFWKLFGGSKENIFTKALFYAFRLDPSTYKTGLTMVFFKSGDLAKLDEVLKSSSHWKSNNDPKKTEVIKRFKQYYIRMKWRIVFAQLYATKQFTDLLEEVRERERKREEERRRIEAERKAELERQAAEAEEAERLVQERIENEKRIEERLQEQIRKREEEEYNPNQMDEEEAHYDQLLTQLEEVAEIEVKEKHKDRGLSLTSEAFNADLKENLDNVIKGYALMESQHAFEASLQKAFATWVTRGKDALDKITDFFKPLVERITEQITDREYWKVIRQQNDTRMKEVNQRWRALNRVVLNNLRKNKHFAKMEAEVMKNVNVFKDELSKVREEDRIRTQVAIGAGANDMRKVESVVVLNTNEMDRPIQSAVEIMDKIKPRVENGEIGASVLTALQQKYNTMDGKYINRTKSGRFSMKHQYTPENRYSDHEPDDDFEEIPPSEDRGNWLVQTLEYQGGEIYFSNVAYDRKKKLFSIKCAWEYQRKKGKREKIVTSWEVFNPVTDLAMLYQCVLEQKGKKPFKKELKDIDVPVFPTWDEDTYKAAIKKNGNILSIAFGHKRHNASFKILKECTNTKAIQKNPEQVDAWWVNFLSSLSQLDSGEQLFELEAFQRALEVDIYAGLENY